MKKAIKYIMRKIIIGNRFLIPVKTPRLPVASNEINLSFTGNTALDDMKAKGSEIFTGFSQSTSVLIKINANSAFEYPSSTSMEILKAIIKILQNSGVTKICVADCSALSRLPSKSIFMQKELPELKRNGIKVMTFDYGQWVKVALNARFFKKLIIPKAVYKYDRIINLANLKTHRLAGYTSAVKNLIGFMHPFQRFELHSGNLEQRIAEMTQAILPDINIVDARSIFISGGPDHGECYPSETIIVDNNIVRADISAYKLLVKAQVEAGVESLETDHKMNLVIKTLLENMRSEQ